MKDGRESSLSSLIEEKYINSYGVHRWSLKDKNIKLLTAVSAGNWTDFTERLEGILPIDRLIVSPELITCTEIESANVSESRELIESRIEQMKKFSINFPEATIVLGTAIFGDEEKPKNGALFIKNGEIVGETTKKSTATEWENDNFSHDLDEKAVLIPGTSLGLLLCSDLSFFSIFSKGIHFPEAFFKKLKQEDFIGKNPEFIHSEAKGIIVSSCWGIGGNKMWQDVVGESTDSYYASQLRAVTKNIMMLNKEIDEIAVVDRVPDVGSDYEGIVSSKPINAFFGRK